MPAESFKILGIISVAMAVAAAMVLVKLWPRGTASSISQHAGGGHRAAYLLFAGVLIGGGFLFFLFMWRWFIPALQLPAGFGYVMALGYALLVATALIPDRADGGRASRLHGKVAYSMAGVMPVLTLWLALAPGVSVLARIVAAAATAWMVVCVYLYIFVKSTHPHYLVYQSSYIASFYASILAAAYLH